MDEQTKHAGVQIHTNLEAKLKFENYGVTLVTSQVALGDGQQNWLIY